MNETREAVRAMSQLGASYGRGFGAMSVAAGAFNRSLVAAFEQARRYACGQLTDDEREAMRQRRYRRQIAQEREIGLRHVRREAARVRSELGLS